MKPYLLQPVGENFEYPTSRHAAMILPDGRLMLFDNCNFMDRPEEGEALDQSKLYSRAAIYTIDEKAGTIRQDWQYGQNCPEIYSPFVSDVDYLPNNHYLFNFGGIYKGDDGSNYDIDFTPAEVKNQASLILVAVEVVNNEVVFEATLFGGENSNSYKAERTDLYRNAKELQLGTGEYKVIQCK